MRFLSIDLLRAAAIILMIVVHFVENLSLLFANDLSVSQPAAIAWLPSGFAAPIFTFLTGVSYRLWVHHREDRGDTALAITKASVRRGLMLIGLGFVFNVLIWLPEDTFNWDILTFIGSGLILLSIMRHAPPVILPMVSCIVLALTPALQSISDYPSYWQEGFFNYDLTLFDIALGFLCVGYFPICPWIILPMAGFAVAPLIFSGTPHRRLSVSIPVIVGGILLAVCAGVLLAYFGTPRSSAWQLISGWSMLPPSTAYLCGTLGLSMILLDRCHAILDTTSQEITPLGIVCRTLSKHSLSIYVLHHAVHIWPLWAYGLLSGEEASHFWQKAMPASAALSLAALFIFLCLRLFLWMDRTGRLGIEGWMRWLCD
ncbi:MAG: heparan-alpha-glucosaminide N-acetyltransferase domain-containing protein [Planctomycetia bacterium]|nr:heparan-alpha-glucosaminide N-acetyltransferase domain-containing protein [Planctomycetia bacterium]